MDRRRASSEIPWRDGPHLIDRKRSRLDPVLSRIGLSFRVVTNGLAGRFRGRGRRWKARTRAARQLGAGSPRADLFRPRAGSGRAGPASGLISVPEAHRMPEQREKAPPAADPERLRLPLPAAERRRRIRELWIAIVLVVAMGLLLLLPPISGLTQGVADRGLFL